jgi:hypothetical protein
MASGKCSGAISDLLDLRCSDALTEEVVSGIHRIRPSLIGHVLVVTGEVVGAETLELIERYDLSRVPRDRLLQDLVGCQFWPTGPPTSIKGKGI